MPTTAGQKAERVLKFLYGLRNDEVLAALASYGFNTEEYETGWKLLRATGRERFAVPPQRIVDNSVVAELDAWENRWLPLAKITLERRHPAVAVQLFNNLTQQEGPAVVFSVGTFLERYDQMAAGEGSYGVEGKTAAELLGVRGMTETELAKARKMVATLGTIEIAPPAPPRDPAEYSAAEEALWNWYLEWSQVARTARIGKRLLRLLGFGGRKNKGDEPDTPADPIPPPAPIV